MINVLKSWNPKQTLLKEILLKPGRFDEAINLCLEMHASVHTSEMSDCGFTTYEDELWNGLSDEIFRVKLKNHTTIAWDLWHLTRIEDMTANILIAGDKQIIDNNWVKKLNTTVLDTGNAMTDREIEDFSRKIDRNELRNYRIEVGRKTRDIIRHLNPADLKRKMTSDRLNRIIQEGGVLEAAGSTWLIDFWGRKTVSGLLLMPITRHQIVHLNDALKIKEKYSKLN